MEKTGILIAVLTATFLTSPLQLASPLQSAPAVAAPLPLSQIFFGPTALNADAEALIAHEINFVETRPAYAASLAVVEDNADTIKAAADKYGVPRDVAIGVALLENGGSETAKSPAGALGVFQLMPSTARTLGLVVNRKVDERKDPAKNIDAGVRYLKQNYDRFGDWGLATWAYHAGEGNVAKALRIYAENNDGIALPGVNQASVLAAYVDQANLTIHDLLSDPSVETFTARLHDDSAKYPYKVIATATLFHQAVG